jgi:GNAT superfamily N-acetyltransferase
MDAPEISLLAASDGAAVAQMTFPAYRHFLSLEPAARHAEDGDRRIVQPMATLARVDGRPVGLALAELPTADQAPPELLSLYVTSTFRNRGVATALLAQLEDELARRRFSRIEAVYTTGTPTVASLERVLAKRGWESPRGRAVTLRFTPDQAAAMPWYGRVELSESDYQIFPWRELAREERRRLVQSHVDRPWVPTLLEFWRHDRHGFDELSSLGLRFRGEVVGWMINHRLAPDLVRFTCGFVRADLMARGRLLPLLTASIDRLRGSACKTCSLVTPLCFPAMVDFLRRRCAPWATAFLETRGSAKHLVPSSTN